jgi:hypothetical protein
MIPLYYSMKQGKLQGGVSNLPNKKGFAEKIEKCLEVRLVMWYNKYSVRQDSVLVLIASVD